MPLTAEQREASKARMDALWAKRRAEGWTNPNKGRKRKHAETVPRGRRPAPHAEDNNEPSVPVVASAPVIDIRIDWNTIPLTQAQNLFGKLKTELDKAARAMNQRLSDRPSFPCSGPGCGTLIKDGEEKFKDCAYVPARYICSEKCYMAYQQVEMQRRHAARTRA